MIRQALQLLFFILAVAGLPHVSQAASENDLGPISYANADVKGISDVLFRLRVLRVDDPAAIEERIRIHNCGLHNEYYRNDLAWARIRESYARDLQVSLDTLPQGLEVLSALPIDRYDIASGEFLIPEASKLTNMGIVNVLEGSTGSYMVCENTTTDQFVPRMHPLSLAIKMDVALTLHSFPVPRKEADAFIKVMEERAKTRPFDARRATLVLKLRLIGQDPMASATDPLRRNVLALIDDLRIYDGPQRKTLLFRRDYLGLREKTQKKQP